MSTKKANDRPPVHERAMDEAELQALGDGHERSLAAVNASRATQGLPMWGTVPPPKPDAIPSYTRGEA